MINKSLTGQRIAILAADGFEKIELTVPKKVLEAAGAEVSVISLRSGHIRGMNLHEPAGRVKVDKVISEASPAEYDGLLIPGGFISPDLMRQTEEVRSFVKEFDESKKPIASLCHGPWVLASAGLLSGRTLTSWPGIRDDLVNAGARWIDEEVVRDGNWMTSRGPEDLPAFCKAILDLFEGNAPVFSTSSELSVSAPQAKAPPAVVLNTMKAMPRPSFRTIGMIGIAAVGLVALRSKRAY